MKTSSIVNSEVLPQFIKSAQVFKNISEVKKIFPKISLKNFRVPVEDVFTSKVKAEIIWGKIHSDRGLTQPTRKYIQDILDGDIVKLSLCDIETRRIISAYIFIFSFFDGKEVVMSSDPVDIATMSMRGINSCQNWSNRHHRDRLIGSIVDPFCGIIYLTNGKKTAHGEHMLTRSVVRYVLDNRTSAAKPNIFVEQSYLNGRFEIQIENAEIDTQHSYFSTDDFQNHCAMLFVKTLALKLKKSTIAKHIAVTDRSKAYHRIPYFSAKKHLFSHEISYVDSQILYSTSKKVSFKNIKPF